MTQLDPKAITTQADDLLNDINQANLQFVNNSNKIIAEINTGFKTTDQLNNELEKAEYQTLEEIDGQILDHLQKTEE